MKNMEKFDYMKIGIFIFALLIVINSSQKITYFFHKHTWEPPHSSKHNFTLPTTIALTTLASNPSTINTPDITFTPATIQISTPKNTDKQLLLAVGVLNRLSLKGRRDVIRMTWFNQCKKNPGLVKCNFFTDSIDDLKKADAEQLLEEQRIHNDMAFMPIKGGHRFAERLIWMLQWYTDNHSSFQYFLRVDDDYFICMDRLLYELPFRPDNGLYWGYTHCADNIIRVDEGWMVLSRDIVKEALSKLNTTLPCHPFGDQAVALWIRDSKLNIKWFPDNNRIIHHATAYKESKYMTGDVCHRYLAMHGSYKVQMLKYWILTQEHSRKETSKRNKTYFIPRIPQFSSFCTKNMTFNVNVFYPHVRFQPKPCKNKPEWRVTKDKFVGREEYGKEMIF